MGPSLWIDVEDLFEYARYFPRPSGIQRVTFEIYRTLQEQYGHTGLVNFVRHDLAGNNFRIVEWDEIAKLYVRLASSKLASTRMRQQVGHELLRRLPTSLRERIVEVQVTHAEVFRAWFRLFKLLFHRLKRIGRHSAGLIAHRFSLAAVTPDRFATAAKPGDILLVLGWPWSRDNYASLVQALKQTRGLRVGVLIYDLIPLRRPEWCDRTFVRAFGRSFDSLFPLCDHVFAISRATAVDVEHYARERELPLPKGVISVPIGTSFGTEPVAVVGNRSPRIPPAGSYALMVSTIEARKNHLLLFRVWRRMLDELTFDQVPTLVFAGRVGWLVNDLMQQIVNTNNLDGKLVLIENPTDAEIVELYRGCLFTMFPSFFEGWGLPVSESLAFGKPCLAADRTSLPEAGGQLTRYFDPDNLNDAYRMIHAIVVDRAELAKWEAQIRREFLPVSWLNTVDTLLSALEHPLAASTMPIQQECGCVKKVASVNRDAQRPTVAVRGRR